MKKNKNLIISPSNLTKLNQLFWKQILKFAQKRMNIGKGGDFNKSGELYFLKHLCKYYKNEASIIIFDVGANVGYYSKKIAALFDKNTKIYSFEPSKKTFELFLNTTKNIDNIFPNNLGFSDNETKSILYSNNDGSGLASVYNRKLDHFDIKMDKTEEISLTTIDNFCTAHKIDKIHFLKLDVEGHELKALIGAKNMINEGKIDVIQFEFGGCNIDSGTYFRDFYYLLSEKYTIYRLLKHGVFEIQNYQESYEIFKIVNFLAIKK
jgi:methyltransferase, FkbM family